MSDGRDALIESIGYTFRDASLLEDALTHRSARGRHNERLEYLGDALLNFVVADALFHAHPKLDEGDLTRLRASLVRAETLAAVARGIDLGSCLVLGGGALKSGDHRRESILGDALEALIGAVYLDGGFEAGRALVVRLFAPRLEAEPDLDALKDPKTRLQEWLQERGHALPVYELLAEEGAAHARRFRVRCSAGPGTVPADGEGSSRRAAEQEAARTMLERLAADDD